MLIRWRFHVCHTHATGSIQIRQKTEMRISTTGKKKLKKQVKIKQTTTTNITTYRSGMITKFLEAVGSSIFSFYLSHKNDLFHWIRLNGCMTQSFLLFLTAYAYKQES